MRTRIYSGLRMYLREQFRPDEVKSIRYVDRSPLRIKAPGDDLPDMGDWKKEIRFRTGYRPFAVNIMQCIEWQGKLARDGELP